MDKLYDNWNDLVFEYRHKEYGAYALRRSYPFYLTVSTLIVLVLFVGGMVGPRMFGEKQVAESSAIVKKVQYVDLKEAPPIDRIDLPKPAVAKYVAPKVTQEDVKPEEAVPTVDQAVAANVETIIETPKALEEVKEVIVVEPPPPVVVVEKEPEPVPDVIIDPDFPGGKKELAKWLSKHLEYPAMAQRMGIEGRVVVEFTVDENGKISDATVVESLHKLCDNEALRLVKSMPAWIPGEKNGVKTTTKFKQSIRFILN